VVCPLRLSKPERFADRIAAEARIGLRFVEFTKRQGARAENVREKRSYSGSRDDAGRFGASWLRGGGPWRSSPELLFGRVAARIPSLQRRGMTNICRQPPLWRSYAEIQVCAGTE
jgi:hypothetical protein